MRVFLLALAAIVLGLATGVSLAVAKYGWPFGGDPFDQRVLSAYGTIDELPSDGRRPRVSLEEESFDFGDSPSGKTLKHSFIVKNTGDFPLELEHDPTRDSSCSCTVGKVSDDKIPPGGQAPIEMEVRTETKSGPLRETATVHTNDPQRPLIRITLTGNITPPVSAEPEQIVFSGLSAKETRTATFHVLARHTDQLAITDVRLGRPENASLFDVSYKMLSQEELAKLDDSAVKSAAEFTVTVKPGLALGQFTQTIRIRTNQDETEPIEVPVTGNVVSDLLVTGTAWNSRNNVVYLGRVASSTGVDSLIALLARGPHIDEVNVKVKSVQPADVLKVSVGKPMRLGSGKLLRIPIEISIPKGCPTISRLGPDAKDMGEIVLETGHPEVKELRLPVSFSVGG